MEKLHLQTTNVVDENIKRIGELFPNCLTERLSEKGQPETAIQNANIGLNIGLPDANIGLKKKRYSKEEIRTLIVSYCHDWRTAEEIAAYVGRKFMYIRDIVLPQLSDVIEKMYDIPHHPRQKYRTKQKEDGE
ncbi:MAG: hypothetical protein IJT19_00305 [Bacteroidaceae bacterium]|nr:hypothetical protein [Bacteroidaceae bacterium]